MKTIHTNLFSSKAATIIKKFHSGLNDWGSRQMSRNCKFSTVEVAPDGEVVLNVDNSVSSYSYNKTAFAKHKTNEKTLSWIAWVIKCLTQRWLNNNGHDKHECWKRDSNINVSIFSDEKNNVTVADLYLVYETLKNRKNISAKYASEQIASMNGQQRDPLQVEMVIAKREMQKKIDDKYAALFDDCKYMGWEYHNIQYLKGAALEIRKTVDAIKAKWNLKARELEAQKKKELDELESSFDFSMMS